MGNLIIGRDGEQAAISSFLDQVESGGSACVIEGEPGIGKSTLWKAGTAAAVDRSYRVLTSMPVEPESNLSFTGLNDLLDPILDEILPRLAEAQQHALSVALFRESTGRTPLREGAVSMGCLRALKEHLGF